MLEVLTSAATEDSSTPKLTIAMCGPKRRHPIHRRDRGGLGLTNAGPLHQLALMVDDTRPNGLGSRQCHGMQDGV